MPNEIEQARESGKIQAKLDMLITKVDTLETTLHERVGNTNDDLKELDRKTDVNAEDIAHIKGGIKALWGVAILICTILGGIGLKVFFG